MKTATDYLSFMRDYNDSKYVDLEGNMVQNNPINCPYSYDPYVIYQSSLFNRITDVPFYSHHVMCPNSEVVWKEVDDVLSQMNLKRYGPERKCLSWKNPTQVERFMSLLMKQDVKCTAILQCCTPGNIYWTVYLR